MSDIDLTYIQPDGSEVTISVGEGLTLMEAALFNGVEGIQGLCGGICSCATCHVELEPQVAAALDAPNEGEAEMLEALDDSSPTSRLGCQVQVSDKLNGARIRVLGTAA